MRLRLEHYESPCAPILVVTDDEGALRALEFADHESRIHRFLRDHYGEYDLKPGAAPKSIIRSLDAYFDGDLTALDSIQTATGGTPSSAPSGVRSAKSNPAPRKATGKSPPKSAARRPVAPSAPLMDRTRSRSSCLAIVSSGQTAP